MDWLEGDELDALLTGYRLAPNRAYAELAKQKLICWLRDQITQEAISTYSAVHLLACEPGGTA